MRFAKFHFRHCRHLHDKTLDFSQQHGGVHLIYGPNESGKSTARQAMTLLLFGMLPTRLNKDQLLRYQYDTLLRGDNIPVLFLGATLRRDDGNELTFFRHHAGDKKELLDAQERPLSEKVLEAFLGIGYDLFDSRFILTPRRVREGSQELLESDGRLGHLLFSTITGFRQIRKIHDELQDEADKIYKPRGRSLTLNQAIEAFKRAKKEINERSVKPKEWHDLDRQMRENRATYDDLVKQKQENTLKLEKIRREIRILPLIQKNAVLQKDLAELASLAHIPRSHRDERIETEKSLEHIRESLEASLLEQKHLHEELDALPLLSEELLQESSRIETLKENTQSYLNALKSKDEWNIKIADLEQWIKTQSVQLGYEDGVPSIDKPKEEFIRQLISEDREYCVLQEQLEKSLQAIELEREEILRHPSVVPPSPDNWKPLKEWLGQSRHLIELELEYQRWQSKRQQLYENLQKELEQLQLWQGTPEDAALLYLPDDSTIEWFKKQWDDLTNEQQMLRKSRKEIENQIQKSQLDLARLRSQGEIYTEEDLSISRERRDTLWDDLKHRWQQGNEYPVPIVDSYAFQIKEADQMADVIRKESQRVADYRRLQIEQKDQQEKLERIILDEQHNQASEEDCVKQWEQLWQTFSIQPSIPRMMQSWLNRWKQLVQKIRAWQAEEASGLERQVEIEHYFNQAKKLFPQAIIDQVSNYSRLNDLIEVGGHLIEQWESSLKTYQHFQSRVQEIETRYQNQKKVIQNNQVKRSRWLEKWQETIAILQRLISPTTAEVEMLLKGLDQIAQQQSRLREYQTNVKLIGQEIAAFEQEVKSLHALCIPQRVESLFIDIARSLFSQLDATRKHQQKREQVIQAIRRMEQEITRLQHRETSLQARLQGMMELAQVSTLTDLKVIEEKVEHYWQQSERLHQVKESLALENYHPENVMPEWSALDPSTLHSQEEELSQVVGKQDQEILSLRENIGGLEQQIAFMNRQEGAYDAALEAEQAMATLQQQVVNYLRLKASAKFLKQKIDHYALEHQEPILALAKHFFAEMTNQAFSGVSVTFDKKGTPSLVGVRYNQEHVPVPALSEGTRDQLYLALYLAGIEYHLRQGESMPLILDDFLVTFDDDRTLATLRCLAQLSNRIQIFLFTHHRHLIDLVKGALLPNQYTNILL